ncbi:MAG: secretin N-terminal domain-containing protein, partial [Planctomycetota bacterium]
MNRTSIVPADVRWPIDVATRSLVIAALWMMVGAGTASAQYPLPDPSMRAAPDNPGTISPGVTNPGKNNQDPGNANSPIPNFGRERPGPNRPAAGMRVDDDPNDPIVELNLAGTVALPKLVEAVAQQMDVRFLYSADLAGRSVTVYTPARLPQSTLPVLMGSLLKAENLAIVDSDVPGWKRIVDVSDMVAYAKPGQSDEVLRRDGPAAAVTQVIEIQNADITSLANSLKPFLSKSANLITLAKNRLLIVTDYAQNVARLVDLLRIIDQPSDVGMIEFYEAKRRDVQTLIQQVTGLRGGTDAKTLDFRLFADASGRRILIAGGKTRVRDVIDLLKRLDSGSPTQTKLYRLENLAAGRLASLVDRLAGGGGEDGESSIETTLDEGGNFLIVRAPASVHAQVRKLVEQLDRPIDATASPIRFYKLKNASAAEVLYSLLALQQATGTAPANFAGGGFGLGGGVIPAGGGFFGGLSQAGLGVRTGNPNMALGNPNMVTGMPFNNGNAGQVASSAGRNLNRNVLPGGQAGNNPASLAGASGLIGTAGLGGNALANAGFSGGGLGFAGGGGLGFAGGGLGGTVVTLPGGANVSADVATNSLIVVAPANVQALYEKLIRSLDQRRPQVMIEAEIVAVDTTNNFRLGVEISAGDRDGSSRLFEFTSFGLSEVDPENGRLTVNPALGFNGVLIDPDVADVIVQALSQHTRSRVLASPKVLVNDNQTGTLESVTSVPFQSINTINTISTQSLGGEQQAGTIITATPQINENNHLQLEFEVEFSTFGEGGTANLPPPRQIDRVGSVVTIPNGKTVVVGGLKRISQSEGFTGVPLLERIPLLRDLTSLQTNNDRTTSFFLFIRPRILRDSRFRDLEYLAGREVDQAQIRGDFPDSRPILIPCVSPPTPTQTPTTTSRFAPETTFP